MLTVPKMPKTAPTAAAARLLAFVAFALAAVGVDAWSGGAGTCEVGSDGPAFPDTGAPHNDGGRGELGSGKADSFYAVTLDGGTGSAVYTLDDSSVQDVAAGTDFKLQVYRGTNSNSDVFKGVLVTLQSGTGQGDAGDVSGSFKMSDDQNVQILESEGDGASANPTAAAVCKATVSGATHTNADAKTGAVLTMNVPSGTEGLVNLTVTVMRASTTWYFSTFRLNIMAGPPTPTAPGTSPPTAAPVVGGNTTTAAPSGAPVLSGGVRSAVAAGVSALALPWIIA